MGFYELRKNYLAKLVKYMKNVYHIEKGLNQLTDVRINPTYDTAQVVTLVLLGFLLRINSFNELNIMNSTNYFRRGRDCHWLMLFEILLKLLILKD